MKTYLIEGEPRDAESLEEVVTYVRARILELRERERKAGGTLPSVAHIGIEVALAVVLVDEADVVRCEYVKGVEQFSK